MFSEKVALALASIVNDVARERGIKPFNSGNIFSDLEEAALILSGNHKAAGTATVAKLQPSAGKPESELLSAYNATEGDPVARAQFLAKNEGALRELVRNGRTDAKPAQTDEAIMGQFNAITDPEQRAAFVVKNEAALRAIASQHSN